MAPPHQPDRPSRRRRRTILTPTREELEVRIVPAQVGTIAPLASVVPDGSTTSPTGYSPQQIRAAYGFDTISFGGVAGDGAGQTIAIVDAYDDPDLVDTSASNYSTSDLAEFDQEYGLPSPPSFTKINEAGNASPLPGTDPAGAGSSSGNWEYEEAMDVEWAHALAPAASIVLIEANSGGLGDLYSAINTAAHLPGVSVVSLSWGGSEYAGENYWDQNFQTPAGHEGETFVASSGDAGAPGIYPAYSPDVIAVGGTQLQLSSDGSIEGETAWSGSGGGTSQYETEPSYQEGVQDTGKRTIPDVSFDASIATGVSVYDSYDNTGGGPWVTMYGTSLGAPSWSALIAIADQGRVAAGGTTLDGASQTLPALYSLPSADFNDITSGGNGQYSAGPGYDEVTGLGSPVANLLAPDLAFYGMSDQLAIAAGPGSSVTAGQDFSVTVDVDQPDGSIDTSASGTLTLSLSGGPGGSLGGTLTATVVDGVATFSGLSIDLAGSGYALSVSGGGLGSAMSSTFSVTPASVSQLVIASQPPTSVEAGSGFGLTVDLEDAFGNLVTGATDDVTLTLSGAGLNGTSSVPATGGVAAFSGLSIDQAGTGYTIQVSDGGLTASASPIAVTPAAPSQLVIQSGPPSSLAAGAGFGLTVEVEDTYGNLVTSDDGIVTVGLSGGPAGAVLGGPGSVAAVDGVATFSGLDVTAAGSGYSLTASAAGLSSATTSTFSVTSAAASKLAITAEPPASVEAGTVFGLAVAAEDAYGNPVTNATGTVTLAMAGGGLGGSLSLPLTDGVADFSGLSIDRAGSGYAIEATADGLSAATTAAVSVTPAAPAQLAIEAGPPSGVAAGSDFGLAVAVEDAYGNLETNDDAPVTLGLAGAPSGTVLGGTTTEPAVGGVATFVGLTLDQVGSSDRIAASSPGLTGATTAAVDVSPNVPGEVAITAQPPASVTAGADFGLSVAIDDAFGNPLSGYSGTVTVSLASGASGTSLSGVTSVSAVNGLATFSGLSIDRAGQGDILLVTAQGAGGFTTRAMQVVPGAPSQVVITNGPSGDVMAGRSFGITAAVEDAYGNVVTSFDGDVTAALATNPGRAALAGDLTIQADGGVAVFSDLIVRKAGPSYAVTVTSGDLTPALTSVFKVTRPSAGGSTAPRPIRASLRGLAHASATTRHRAADRALSRHHGA